MSEAAIDGDVKGVEMVDWYESVVCVVGERDPLYSNYSFDIRFVLNDKFAHLMSHWNIRQSLVLAELRLGAHQLHHNENLFFKPFFLLILIFLFFVGLKLLFHKICIIWRMYLTNYNSIKNYNQIGHIFIESE